MPALSRLMKPARIISLWLVTSASAGASLRVEMKNWVAFMQRAGLSVGGESVAWRDGARHRPDRRKVGQKTAGTRGLVSRHTGVIMNSTNELGLIMLDREGFRPNVGIVLLNQRNQVFWGKRIRTHSWQFPQGGIKYGETPEQAMYRELQEEVGLVP